MNMTRYLKLFSEFLKFNLIREVEFRGSFVIRLLVDFCWIFLHLAVLQIYFSFTSNIAGWSRPQVFALVGIFRIIKGLFDTYFRLNLTRLPEVINRGEFDFILAKPVNTLFLTSTRYHQFSEFFSTLTGVAILLYAVRIENYSLSVLNLAALFTSVFLGLLVFYSLILLLATLSFFFTRVTSIRTYYDVISNMVRVPTDAVFSNRLNTILFPLFLIVTLPAQIFLGKAPYVFLLLEASLALIIFLSAYRFWLFALRHYSSASS